MGRLSVQDIQLLRSMHIRPRRAICAYKLKPAASRIRRRPALLSLESDSDFRTIPHFAILALAMVSGRCLNAEDSGLPDQWAHEISFNATGQIRHDR